MGCSGWRRLCLLLFCFFYLCFCSFASLLIGSWFCSERGDHRGVLEANLSPLPLPLASRLQCASQPAGWEFLYSHLINGFELHVELISIFLYFIFFLRSHALQKLSHPSDLFYFNIFFFFFTSDMYFLHNVLFCHHCVCLLFILFIIIECI